MARKNLNIEMMAAQRQTDKNSKIERHLNNIAKHRFKTQEILAKEHFEKSELKMALADEYVRKYGKVKSMYLDSALFTLGIAIIIIMVNQL